MGFPKRMEYKEFSIFYSLWDLAKTVIKVSQAPARGFGGCLRRWRSRWGHVSGAGAALRGDVSGAGAAGGGGVSGTGAAV